MPHHEELLAAVPALALALLWLKPRHTQAFTWAARIYRKVNGRWTLAEEWTELANGYSADEIAGRISRGYPGCRLYLGGKLEQDGRPRHGQAYDLGKWMGVPATTRVRWTPPKVGA